MPCNSGSVYRIYSFGITAPYSEGQTMWIRRYVHDQPRLRDNCFKTCSISVGISIDPEWGNGVAVPQERITARPAAFAPAVKSHIDTDGKKYHWPCFTSLGSTPRKFRSTRRATW